MSEKDKNSAADAQNLPEAWKQVLKRRDIARVVSQSGHCSAGLKVGQEYDLGDGLVLGFAGDGKQLCPLAFYAAVPYWRGLRYGATFPWEEEGTVRVACPDPRNPLTLELRIEES